MKERRGREKEHEPGFLLAVNLGQITYFLARPERK